MPWFVFDPEPELPEEGTDPKLYGPFDDADEARDCANVMHPDDEGGDCIVLENTELVA